MAKILLVEDDTMLLDMYATKLERAGYEVVVALNAQQCLDALDEATVDLIVLDMLLPLHNGMMVLQELQSYPDWRHIPIVVFSNLPAKEVNANPRLWEQLGVVKYLYKPAVKPSGLVRHIKALLGE